MTITGGTPCPKCGAVLKVDSAYAGYRIKCGACSETFVAPQIDDLLGDEEDDEAESTPAIVIWSYIGVGHFAAVMFLSMLWSPVTAVTVVFLLGLIELAIWQRHSLLALFQSTTQSETARSVGGNAKNGSSVSCARSH